MNSLSEKLLMKNGYGDPCVGFGTWKTPTGEIAVESVKTAIESGYRHIDAAAAYGNELSVGAGIKAGLEAAGIKREELFITSKVWNPDRGYDKTIAAFNRTLQDLGLDYLDLYLIHWPAAPHQMPDWNEVNVSTWKAMTDLYKDGKIRSIGVANFRPSHLKSLMEYEISPMVDQIEFHPGFKQDDIVPFCRENGIVVEAWSPMGNGRMLNNEQLTAMAEKYNKSVAQICIRWCIQNNVIPLPKSKTPERIRQNAQVFDFEILEEDMAIIDAMDNFGGSGLDPDKVSTLP